MHNRCQIGGVSGVGCRGLAEAGAGRTVADCRSNASTCTILATARKVFLYSISRKIRQKMSDSEDNAGVPLVEPLSDSASPKPQISTKRKRDAEGKKSAKRRKLKKPKDVEDDALDAELGVNHAIGKMDDSLMADHIAQRTRRFRSELSLVEAEDIHIPGMRYTMGSAIM